MDLQHVTNQKHEAARSGAPGGKRAGDGAFAGLIEQLRQSGVTGSDAVADLPAPARTAKAEETRHADRAERQRPRRDDDARVERRDGERAREARRADAAKAAGRPERPEEAERSERCATPSEGKAQDATATAADAPAASPPQPVADAATGAEAVETVEAAPLADMAEAPAVAAQPPASSVETEAPETAAATTKPLPGQPEQAAAPQAEPADVVDVAVPAAPGGEAADGRTEAVAAAFRKLVGAGDSVKVAGDGKSGDAQKSTPRGGLVANSLLAQETAQTEAAAPDGAALEAAAETPDFAALQHAAREKAGAGPIADAAPEADVSGQAQDAAAGGVKPAAAQMPAAGQAQAAVMAQAAPEAVAGASRPATPANAGGSAGPAAVAAPGAGPAQAAGATPAAAQAPRPAPHQPVVDQVSVHLKKAAAEGRDSVTIKLKPASLGHVEISLDIKDGRVAATVVADRRDTFELLQRDARGLEKALSDAGLQTDSGSLSFNLRGDGREGGYGREAHAQSQRGGPHRAGDAGEEPRVATSTQYTGARTAAGGIDIQV